MSTTYRVLVGVDYPPGKRAEAGQVVSDLPDGSIKWLTRQGMIEPAGNPEASPKPPAKGTT